MGIAKTEWMEAQERGWDAPDKFVCVDCFEDDYLKSVIIDCATHTECDYCDYKSSEPIAAPLSDVLEPIAYALFSHFTEPGEAGLPRDSGEWVGEESITYTQDALLAVGLSCDGELFDDIAGSFLNDAWYPCAHGHWLDIHEHESLVSGHPQFSIWRARKCRYTTSAIVLLINEY